MKFCFLIPVWGENYVDLLMRYSVGALLAPGNIPYLENHGGCECVFLTTKSSAEYIDAHPSTADLRKCATVSFLDISGIIVPSHYGLTLTAAYALGMKHIQSRNKDTWFVLLNADFVLSNNVCKSLMEISERGFRAVACPTVRVTEGPLFSALDATRAPDGKIDLPPRPMVDIALQDAHPTFQASFLNQYSFSISHPNKLSWRVDQDTVISRFFLRMPLAIRPQKRMVEIVGYCDYSFLPHLVRPELIYCVRDSDEMFILECAAGDQESELLVDGKAGDAELADALTLWTTELHREFGKVDYVIHAKELPQALDAERAAFDRRMDAITSKLDPMPRPWKGHQYWQFNWGALGASHDLKVYATLMDDTNRRTIRQLLRVSHRRFLSRLGDYVLRLTNRLCWSICGRPLLEIATNSLAKSEIVTDIGYLVAAAKRATPLDARAHAWGVLRPDLKDLGALFVDKNRAIVLVMASNNLRHFLELMRASRSGHQSFRLITYDCPLGATEARLFYQRVITTPQFKTDDQVRAVKTVQFPHEHLLLFSYLYQLLAQPVEGVFTFAYRIFLFTLLLMSMAYLVPARFVFNRIAKAGVGGVPLYIMDGPDILAFADALVCPSGSLVDASINAEIIAAHDAPSAPHSLDRSHAK